MSTNTQSTNTESTNTESKTTTKKRSWPRTAAVAVVLALAAVPAAVTTVSTPPVAQAEVCANYHGALISTNGCSNVFGYAAPAPGAPAPPPPGRACGNYHGPRINANGCI